MSETRETGLRIFGEAYGEAAAAAAARHLESDAFAVDQARWAIDFAFGTVWAREGIERKLRSAAVLGMLIALRQEDEIGHHTRMGLANGLTRGELEEILLTAVPYCGLPATNNAKAAMLKAFAELDAAQGQ